MNVGGPRADLQQIREAQSARFQNVPERRILEEITQVLQDLGFTVEESAPRLGVLAGSKDRDATEVGQVAAQVALTIGLAVLGVRYTPIWDTDQVIRVTLTSRPSQPNEVVARVSFERIVTTNQGTSRVEVLTTEEFSSGFFERVRQGLARAGA
ncbi:MAG: hypothetical protein K2X11_10770 [Acetobacteraceae bacterium]|nr:hypothetical protein [Acetobacteraceae bacterium]